MTARSSFMRARSLRGHTTHTAVAVGARFGVAIALISRRRAIARSCRRLLVRRRWYETEHSLAVGMRAAVPHRPTHHRVEQPVRDQLDAVGEQNHASA